MIQPPDGFGEPVNGHGEKPTLLKCTRCRKTSLVDPDKLVCPQCGEGYPSGKVESDTPSLRPPHDLPTEHPSGAWDRSDYVRMYDIKCQELSASHAVIRELYAAVESLLSSMERLDLKEGHCMCGAAPSKFGYCDNHGYVDAGEYLHGLVMDKARASLAHAVFSSEAEEFRNSIQCAESHLKIKTK